MTVKVADVGVLEVMNRWPNTLAVFIRHRMFCVGCEVAPFHTVADACIEHDLDEAVICNDLNQVIAASGVDAAQ